MAQFEIYHTAENRGNASQLIGSGGVFADTTDLFLGKGYYYWEKNYNEALGWGQKRYRGNFFVFHGVIQFDLDKMFDLSTQTHNQFIRALYSKYEVQFKAKTKERTFFLGLFIDFIVSLQEDLIRIKRLSSEDKFFPFLYSKAIDHSSMKKIESESFSRRAQSWYYSNPVVFFCVYNKNDLSLCEFKLIKTAGEAQ